MTIMVTLILVTCLTCAAGELRHVPLTSSDMDTVLHDDTGQDVIHLESIKDDQHCLLTVNGGLEDTEGCTLRESRFCSPRAGCVETEAGVRVVEARCEVRVTRAPVTDSLRVCSARGEIMCSGPCYKVSVIFHVNCQFLIFGGLIFFLNKIFLTVQIATYF